MKSALVRDAEWLIENGLNNIDPARFCDWVTRLWHDGMSENEARLFVLEEMVNE